MKLSANELYVLSSLSNGDQYGLGIIKEVKESGVELYLGGLYTILRRLEKQKYIKGYYKEETEDRAGNRRRYYKILAAGDRALDEARAALMDLWGLKVLNSSFLLLDILIILSTVTFFLKFVHKYFIGIVFFLTLGFTLLGLGTGLTFWGVESVRFIVLFIFCTITTVSVFFYLEKRWKTERIIVFLKKKLFSLRYLLPKKYREEIVGDLIEIKNGLKNEGHGKPWILTILFGQFLSIIYSMLWFKVGEVYEKKAYKEEEVNEELELKPLDGIEDRIERNEVLYKRTITWHNEEDVLEWRKRGLLKKPSPIIPHNLQLLAPLPPRHRQR